MAHPKGLDSSSHNQLQLISLLYEKYFYYSSVIGAFLNELECEKLVDD